MKSPRWPPSSWAERLQQLEDAQSQSRQRQWQAYSRKLRSDPTTVLYYSFDDQEPWERTLRDVSLHHDEFLDGAIVGCLWTEGRWPGKGALEFKRISDRVRIYIPGQFKSLTLEAWVRVEGLDHKFCSLLLTDGYEDPGEIHWQMDAEGTLILGAYGAFRTQTSPVIGPDYLGRWVHLACVIDGETRSATHYLDGARIAWQQIAIPSPLQIGHAQIGNWNPVFKSYTPIRTLNGRIDELGIFARAFSDDEIRGMYETGKPNP